jgi:ankyrin repeat protein
MEASLLQAAKVGKLKDVCTQLQKGANVNATNELGESPLMKASWNGHTDIVQELLKHDGVDVNHRNVEGETALMLASCQGHVDIVEALLKQDALGVYHRNNKHKTALDLARQYNHKGTVTRLEEHIKKTRIKQAQDSLLRSMMESPALRFS